MKAVFNSIGNFYGRATVAGRMWKSAESKGDYALAIWVQLIIFLVCFIAAEAISYDFKLLMPLVVLAVAFALYTKRKKAS